MIETVNGFALDAILAGLGGQGDIDKIMHAFVRVPMQSPRTKGKDPAPGHRHVRVNVAPAKGIQ